MSDPIFQQIIDDAGIPSTENDLMAEFRQIAIDEGVVFNNESGYSPFWRMVLALATKPVVRLIGLLRDQYMPNAFMKTASGIWVDMKLWEMGLERKAAQKARGEITLTRESAAEELLVPAGLVIQSSAINNVVYRLISLNDQTFTVGSLTLDIIVEAEETGSAYNLGDGFYTAHSSDLAGIVNVSNNDNWLLVPGSDEESDDDAKSRYQNEFTAVSDWFIDAVYKSIITKFSEIDIDDIYFNHDAPRGPGTANAYILTDAATLSNAYLNTITSHVMNGNNGLSDDLKVFNMPTSSRDITANCEAEINVSDADKVELKTGIENFIKTAFRELPIDNYKATRILPNSTFVWSRLIKELHLEFPNLLSIDFADDANIETQLNIITIDTLTVNIE